MAHTARCWNLATANGRTLEAVLRHALTLEALAPASSGLGGGRRVVLPPDSPLGVAQGYLAEYQHHDAVTGTHETNVTRMYQDHLDIALATAEASALAALERLAAAPTGAWIAASVHRPELSTGAAGAATAVLLVRNALGWDRTNVLVTVAVPSRTARCHAPLEKRALSPKIACLGWGGPTARALEGDRCRWTSRAQPSQPR